MMDEVIVDKRYLFPSHVAHTVIKCEICLINMASNTAGGPPPSVSHQPRTCRINMNTFMRNFKSAPHVLVQYISEVWGRFLCNIDFCIIFISVSQRKQQALFVWRWAVSVLTSSDSANVHAVFNIVFLIWHSCCSMRLFSCISCISPLPC